MQKLLTPEEVAEYLGVKESSWIRQEFIQHVKLGRLVRFKYEEVGKLVECRSVRGKAVKISHRQLD